MALTVILVIAFASTAAALSYSFSFELRNFQTSGTNWHEYAKGTVRVNSIGWTDNPLDGTDHNYKVNLENGVSNYGTSYFTADGVRRNKNLTIPSGGSWYPRVYLQHIIVGTGIVVSGNGTTNQ